MGQRRPARRPDRPRRTRRRAGPRHASPAPRPVGLCASRRRPQHTGRGPRQRPPPLRPVQRPVLRVPRPHPHLLLSGVHRLPRPLRVPGIRPAPQDRPAPGPRLRRRGHPTAGDRHRLGRARPAGSRPRRPGHHLDPLRRTSRTGPRADRGGRTRRPGGRPAARLPRHRGPLRRRDQRRDDRSGGRRVLALLLRGATPISHPRRPDCPAGHHHGASADAEHGLHPHLHQQVHLPRRPDPVPRGHRRTLRGRRPPHDRRPRLRRALRRDPAPVSYTHL